MVGQDHAQGLRAGIGRIGNVSEQDRGQQAVVLGDKGRLVGSAGLDGRHHVENGSGCWAVVPVAVSGLAG